MTLDVWESGYYWLVSLISKISCRLLAHEKTDNEYNVNKGLIGGIQLIPHITSAAEHTIT